MVVSPFGPPVRMRQKPRPPLLSANVLLKDSYASWWYMSIRNVWGGNLAEVGSKPAA
jgi:hypothetical protein